VEFVAGALDEDAAVLEGDGEAADVDVVGAEDLLVVDLAVADDVLPGSRPGICRQSLAACLEGLIGSPKVLFCSVSLTRTIGLVKNLRVVNLLTDVSGNKLPLI